MSDDSQHFQALLRLVQEGSPDAARELTETYGPHIIKCVRRILRPELRSKFDSVDFLQQVWKSIFEEPDKLSELRTQKELINFLCAVTRHKVADEARRRQTLKHDLRRQVRLHDYWDLAGPHPVSRDPTPSSVAMHNERFDALLEGQPPQVRVIIELRYEGWTFREIAERLGVHERTVRRVIERLEDEGLGPPPRESNE